jgi:Ca-activated chloride channel family protein
MSAVAAILLASALAGGGPAGEIERANRLYAEGKFEEAAEIYRSVQADLPASAIPAVNLGAASLKAGNAVEASSAFRKAEETAGDAAVRGQAAYGLGAALVASGDLGGALESFKRAVELLPDDEDAKWNYEVTKRRLEEAKEDESSKEDSQQPDESERREDEKNEKQDDSSKPSQTEKPEGQEPQAQPEDEPSDEPKDEEGLPQPAPSAEADANEGGMSKDEIDRLLESLKQDEKALRARIRRPIPMPRGEPAKDW